MNKIKILVVALAMICSSITSVFAYMYFYETEPTYIASGVILQSYPTPNMTLGFYWDQECTQPVTTFDFGEIIHPNTQTDLMYKIYIRNEGEEWNDIYWNSTLPSASAEISNWWCVYHTAIWGAYPLNGFRLNSGTVITTWYIIRIPAYPTTGNFNWTLTVWGEHYY